MNNNNVGQYGSDGKFNFVDFSNVTSTADATRDRKPAEPTPEQKLQEAVVNLRSYMNVSKNSPLLKYINSVGGMDFIEEGYKQKVYDAYNEYTAWKNNQGAETPTTTDTDTTVKEETKTEVKPAASTNAATKADTIEYTYQPGDTFGQVIKNLGLESGSGLWGANGDVEYYTKQLEDQLWNSGVWSAGERQNIPVGTTIRLTRRPTDPALQEYYKKYGYKG